MRAPRFKRGVEHLLTLGIVLVVISFVFDWMIR